MFPFLMKPIYGARQAGPALFPPDHILQQMKAQVYRDLAMQQAVKKIALEFQKRNPNIHVIHI